MKVLSVQKPARPARAFLVLGAVLTVLAASLAASLAEPGGAHAAQQDEPFAAVAGGEENEFAEAFAGEEEGQGEGLAQGLEWTGFLEMEQGGHVGPDGAQQREVVLSNRLLRLATNFSGERAALFLKLDVFEDSVTGLREASIREGAIKLTPVDWMDVRAGKQVSTWGVGDLLFINDLFPKNWIGIFLGRDPEFWKDTANALRLSSYFGSWSWEVVYHPEFAPDTTPDGCRFSVFDPNAGQLAAFPSQCGQDSPASMQSGTYDEGELASRLKLQAGSYELALYLYDGFFKSPRGLRWADAEGTPTGNTTPTPGTAEAILVPFHPRLNVAGLSVEGQLGPGIVSLEAGRYDSKDDPDGANPFIENSSLKTLLGYRMELSANLAGGVQWFRETMLDHDAYLAARGSGQAVKPREENRDTYTLRITLKFFQETLWINLFHYERPQDRDRFTKFDLSRRLSDSLIITTGLNLFDGEAGYEDREFGMLRDDDNFFARLRFSF